MFKVGDKVRRKSDQQDCELRDSVLTVAGESAGVLSFAESRFTWNAVNFDLVEPVNPPKNRCVEAMVAGKVGPHKVRVWVNVDPATPLTEVHGKQVEAVLDEVRDDYETDPEFGQDDIIVRLQERLESIEAVAAYEITGLDGCGFVVYPDWR
jgi:hypothetical protein